jgi:hypothetical protein
MHNEGSTSNLADARTLLKLYFPVGKAVTVFYSPDDPADSVLKPGVRSWDWFFLAVAGFFLIVPSFFLILILFVPSKDQKSQSDPIELTAKANFDTATE